MNLLLKVLLPGTLEDSLYPDSDGRPMGDTMFHSDAQTWLADALEDHFEQQQVLVARNLIFYFQKGAPEKRRDPDVLVAKGVGKHQRRSFRPWEEKKKPCTLVEILSRKAWRIDLNVKPAEYAAAGVKEYFLFDPEARYLDPSLQGCRTVKGKPVAMKPAADGSLISKQLGLRLVPEGGMLRLNDLKTGQPILTRRERANEATQEAECQRQQKETLAAEIARLRALLKEKGAG
jgi:Uma2 family endonuclease